MRVMLVEDNAAVRRAVASLLDASGDIQVCAEAATVAEAALVAAVSHPDVVIVDLRLPDGSGVEAGREVRAAEPAVRVLLLTSAPEEVALAAATLVGASGYVVKQVLGNDLVATVRAIADGVTTLDHTAGRAAVDRLRARTSEAQDADILALLADGRSNLQIGHDLQLDEMVVKERVASMLSRLAGGRRWPDPTARRLPSTFAG